MKKLIITIMLLIPVPFFFHFYEYNCYLNRQDPKFLFPVFILFIIVVGITSKNIKYPLFYCLNFIMIVISLIFGHLYIVDDGGWFKPFGRNGAIIFVSIIYILGQLMMRILTKQIHANQ